MSAKTKQIDDPTLLEEVSEHYKKFFARFAEIDKLPIREWKALHILSFICKRYEEYYGLKYSFRFNNPAPSKSYEMFQIKKLASSLSSDPEILTDYINWIFDKKIIEKKKRITSLGYFTTTELVNDYKFKFLFNKKTITRADNLPSNIIDICSKFGFDIKTYGELAFVSKMTNQEKLFESLRNINFEVGILDKIA